MNTSKRYLLPFIIVTIFAGLSSCSSSPISRNLETEVPAPATTPNIVSSPSPTPRPTPSPTPSQKTTIAKLGAKSADGENILSATSPATTSKTINVTIYISDTQCQELIPQQASVPAAEPIKGAVGKILEQRDTSDFSLSGYRVNVKEGVATVDLRISPESKRQLASLSSCEQFALFNSLRKTLTSNAKWNIKEVNFTERGQAIAL